MPKFLKKLKNIFTSEEEEEKDFDVSEEELRHMFKKETGKHVFWPPSSNKVTKQYAKWKEKKLTEIVSDN